MNEEPDLCDDVSCLLEVGAAPGCGQLRLGQKFIDQPDADVVPPAFVKAGGGRATDIAENTAIIVTTCEQHGPMPTVACCIGPSAAAMPAMVHIPLGMGFPLLRALQNFNGVR